MQLLVQHAQGTPEPPSARTELPIPKELDAIVLACLAKDPSDRPQTARELARRLEAVPVRGEWTPELARAWWETNMEVAHPGGKAAKVGPSHQAASTVSY